jgi:serine/threonine protein phosphatase PrpC
VGSFSTQGTKPNEPNRTNQDAHLELNLPDGKILVGVFDGHGVHGHVISNRVKSLFAEKAHALASAYDIRGAFQQAFNQVYNQIRNEQMGEASGTTATVALVDSVAQRVSIANVGDSTAIVIDSRGSILFTSQNHRPSEANFAEFQRLRAHGSQMNNGHVFLKTSVNPAADFLGVSRSIGDFRFAQQGVMGKPDVAAGLMFPAGSSLILATDGVWDVVQSDEAMRMIMQSPPQNAAQQLVNVAHSHWTKHPYTDDITAVLVKSVPALPSSLMRA